MLINSVSCFLVLNYNFYTGWPCDRLKNNCVERYSIENVAHLLHIMIPLKIVIILSFILVSHFAHAPTVTYLHLPRNQGMLGDYYSFIYYGNLDCRSNIKSRVTTHDNDDNNNNNNDSGVVTGSVVGIKGYMSDVNYSVPHVNDDISCYDSMSCLYNENGKSCQSEGRINNDEPIAYSSYSTTTTDDNDDSGNYLHSCEGTVVNQDDNSTSASSDANADTTCVSVTPNE
jgi:hypothetical protein